MEKHFTLRGEILSDDMRKNGEAISRWWLPSWCDMLSDELEGVHRESSSKKKAIQRLVPLFEQAMGKVFPKLKALKAGGSKMRVAKRKTKSKKQKTVRQPGTRGLTRALMAKGGKKGSKKVKSKTKVKARNGNGASFDDGQKITVIAKENPKREGTKAFKKFKIYKTGMTVALFLKKGGTRSALRYDTEHDYIKIK